MQRSALVVTPLAETAIGSPTATWASGAPTLIAGVKPVQPIAPIDLTIVAYRLRSQNTRRGHGNPGQHRKLTGGISELKIDFGPGYRVYYTQRGSTLLLLLAGGDKSSQEKDIAVAVRLAKYFKE